MTTALVPFDQLQLMAKAIADSGLFGAKKPAEALALMLVAQAEGKHPATIARDYDLIQGRPAKKAEAMMRDFLESGGSVEWHTLTDECCDATFSHPAGGTVRIEWTMKRASAAGLGGKPVWKQYPRQMLRSRVVSEGIRTVCPMATSGMYVPEEVRDFAKEKDITPTAGAGDRLSLEQQERVSAAAERVRGWLDSGAIGDACAEADNADLDADEMVYFWTFFDSKQRSAMKKENERAKAARKALAAPTESVAAHGGQEGITSFSQENSAGGHAPATDQITDAQKKRLEARITQSDVPRDKVKKYCVKHFGKEHFADLTREEYDTLDEMLEAEIQKGIAEFKEAI